MKLLILFYTFSLGACFYQALCQPQAHHQQAAPAEGCPFSGQHQQAILQQRQCRCDELEQCYKDQTTQQQDLFSRCRHECGVALIPNDTIEQVSNCYQAYEQGKRDQKTNKYRCVENLISRPCLTNDEHQAPPVQATLTVDPTKIVQNRIKRNYKQFYPSQLNMYTACVKTCGKNRGIVQFNLDGTPVKASTKTATNTQHGVAGMNNMITAQKPGKGYALCAAHLGCQLVPVDKQMEKQAKQICKYQTTQVEDQELKLCTCLEGALSQNFQCVPTSAPATETCASQSGEKSACEEPAGAK